MFVAQSIPPAGGAPIVLADVSEAYLSAASGTIPNNANTRVAGTFTWVTGKQFNSNTLNTNGIVIGETASYICGARLGYTTDFAQNAGVSFYINTTATPPQILGTGSGGLPLFPWPWTNGGLHSLTAGQTLGIAAFQASGVTKVVSAGPTATKLWACRTNSPGLVIATPSADYSSGTGQQVCTNHTTNVNNATSNYTVGTAGITINETGKYYICSWGDSTTVAAATSGMGYRVDSTYTTRTTSTVSSTGRLGVFSDERIVGPITTVDGLDISAGSVVAMAHSFSAARTIQAGTGFSGIAIMRAG